MIGPSSYVSKALFTLLLLLVAWFAYMDVLLYLRIRHYPVDRSLFSTPAAFSPSASPSSGAVLRSVASSTIAETPPSAAFSDPSDNNSSHNCAAQQHIHPHPHSVEYADIVWVPCSINPLCHVTIKALLLDHTNQYLFAPAATLFDQALGLSRCLSWITANAISVAHVLVAIAAACWIAGDTLAQRRIGVVAFQVRTFLDDLDGHVARQRRNVRGERSEVGTAGYYMDGVCDALGCVAMLIGIYAHLRHNRPRRAGYQKLQALPMGAMQSQQQQQQPSSPSSLACSKEAKHCTAMYCSLDAAECGASNSSSGSSTTTSTTYHAAKSPSSRKVSGAVLLRHLLVLGAQLLISSSGWNRYIALYQDLLETNAVPAAECARQRAVLRSPLFFGVAWLWRVVNVHAMLHVLLLAVFCDRLWWWLRRVQCWGFVVLAVVVVVTELHAREVEQFVRGAARA